MPRIRAVSALCALILGLAACSDFTSSGDPLTDAEAGELAAVLAEEGFAGFGGAPSPAMAPRANDEAAARITITINDTGSCEGSGTVALAGTLTADINEQAGTGTIEYSYTIVPNNCRVTTESNKVFTLNGDPNIEGAGVLNFGQNSYDGSLTYKGKFRWEEGTRSGACGVNLTVTYDFTVGGTTVNGSASVTGEVCGVSVNRTVTIQDVA